MSTKTSIKRIALVAVSALGFGLLSVVPVKAANTAQIAAALVQSISLATYTDAPTAGTEVAVLMGANVGDASGESNNDYVEFVGYLSAFPSGGFASVAADHSVDLSGATDKELWEDATATVDTSGGATDDVTESTTSGGFFKVLLSAAADANASGDVTAARRVGAAEFNFTPTKSGTYELTVFADIDGDEARDLNEAVQTISISVAAAASTAYSNSLSKAWLVDGNGTTPGTQGSDGLGSVASRTVANAVAASVDITLLNESGTATGGALTNTLSASVSGAGFVKWAATGTNNPVADSCSSASERSASLTATSSDNTLYICADGTSGESTVTIRVTDINGVTSTLATKKVTFHGSVAKLTVDVANYKVAKAAGGTLGDNDATRAGTALPALVIKATDSAGLPVSGLTIQQISSSLAVANTDLSGACNEDNPYTLSSDVPANIYSSGGEGYYNCQIVTPSTAASGNSATLTYRVADPASLTGGYLTAAYPITIGGTLASATIALDKTNYSPGEEMKITWTGKDSSGNVPYDGQNVIGSLTANKSLGAALPTSRSLLNGTRSNSSLAPLFAPAASGPFTLTFFENTDAYTKHTVTATVSDDAATSAANAASDAAAEAIDAANAATDAANLAAEAADAATVAAEEARDAADAATAAVEALATEVATLMAALKAQITTLANTVAKIAKKVKA